MLCRDHLSQVRRIQRRWLMAFRAIYFTRLLVSLSKKVTVKQTKLLRSPSYVALDVDDNNPRKHHDGLVNVDQKKLNAMVKERSLGSLNQCRGVKGVVGILQSHMKEGISGSEADLALRRDVFGANRYQKPPAKSIFRFVIEALKDITVIVLLGCAVMSLVFGIKRGRNGWYDGGSTIVAVFIVIAVSVVTNFKRSSQFEKLSEDNNDMKVQLVRDGSQVPVSIFDIVVGDVVSLKIGDQVPADGLFLEGYSLKVDESNMSGESDPVEVNASKNPFLLSGTKVIDGFGTMLVTSVGMNPAWGEMMSSTTRDFDKQTPLQARLNKLTTSIDRFELVVAAIVLAVLLIRYFTGTTKEEYGSKSKVNDILHPVLGTLTLAFSMKKMMNDNTMVRKLYACETMGYATTICTDKTGTLTLNQMKVTEFWLGKEELEVDTPTEMADAVSELLQEGVALNTTASVNKQHSESDPDITGSPTEKAILTWAALDLGVNVNEINKSCEVLHVEAFNSEKKRSGVLIRRNKNFIRSHSKGAAEMILAMCSNYYVRSGDQKPMDGNERKHFEEIIQGMARKSLRCIAFAHKNVTASSDHEKLEAEIDLTLLALVGLKDPCRPDVKTAVESCHKAGVTIKMITGDNVHTAKVVAIECGILNPEQDSESEAVLEGIQFRNYSPEERMARIDKIKVMARSSPSDKLLMVQCLKQKGHVVAVTGDGANDASALKEANIGLSMGIRGTMVAKESSDIVILDDNFTSVVKALRWGRCVYTNIQKLIQFQLTVNFTALALNFVAAVSSGKVPLTAVQLLWVNLAVDLLGSLALAHDRPTNDLMDKPPVGQSEPLITNVIWRNLMSQVGFQVAILLTLEFKGRSICGVNEKVKDIIIFNTFVFCQVFNEFNARKLEKKNIFEGIHMDKLFLAVVGITVVLQVIMVEFPTRFAGTERLNWAQWGVCIGIAALTWPIGFLVKCIPVPGRSLISQLRAFRISDQLFMCIEAVIQILFLG